MKIPSGKCTQYREFIFFLGYFFHDAKIKMFTPLTSCPSIHWMDSNVSFATSSETCVHKTFVVNPGMDETTLKSLPTPLPLTLLCPSAPLVVSKPSLIPSLRDEESQTYTINPWHSQLKSTVEPSPVQGSARFTSGLDVYHDLRSLPSKKARLWVLPMDIVIWGLCHPKRLDYGFYRWSTGLPVHRHESLMWSVSH